MIPWHEALFTPRRVALVGASATPGKLGHLFMQNLVDARSGFRGDVVAVHPSAGEILGRPAYASLSLIPGGADLAIIVVPPGEVPAVVADCAAAAVPVCVVISGGFAEAGPAGRRLEERTMDAARAGGVRLIGPNCFGVINVAAGLNASLGMGLPARGGVSLFTQSGAYGMAAFSRSQEDLIGFAKVVAPGNKVDIDEADMLRVLGDDPETRVVAMLLESIVDGRRFFEVAAAVAARKPVVVLKTGRGEAGRRAAASHTAALATDHAVTVAALRQAGVRIVEDGLTLLDLAAALDRQPALKGKRVAVITNSGGTGVELTDLLEAEGLQVPSLSPALQDEIRPLLPAYGSPANPIDVTTDWRRFPDMYGGSLETLLRGDEVDAVVPVLLQRSAIIPAVADRIIETVAAARGRGCAKPVHVCWVAPREAEPNRLRLLEAGIPCHSWPARTARVLALCQAVAARTAAPAIGPPVPRPDSAAPGGWLPAAPAFALLAAAGFPVVPWVLAPSRDAAIAAARALGLPVVLKAEREGLVHKSDSGAVRLGLAGLDEVAAAFDDLAAALGPGPALVQRQAQPGIELVIGAKRDAAFGPVVMAGLGGVWVEALGDVALRLAPIDAGEARLMLEELKAGRVLSGGRGRPGVDRDGLARLIADLSRWVAAAPWLDELDVNPVIANADGLVIVDVRMRLGHGSLSRTAGEGGERERAG